MAKPWDDSLKKLVHTDPQAFVTWLFPGGTFIGERPHELKHWTLEVDALLGVTVSEQEMLLHLEFQTYHDPAMAERLLSGSRGRANQSTHLDSKRYCM